MSEQKTWCQIPRGFWGKLCSWGPSCFPTNYNVVLMIVFKCQFSWIVIDLGMDLIYSSKFVGWISRPRIHHAKT